MPTVIETIDEELARLEMTRGRLKVLRHLAERLGEDGDIEISIDGALVYGSALVGEPADLPDEPPDLKSVPPPSPDPEPATTPAPKRVAAAKDSIRREGAADRKQRPKGRDDAVDRALKVIRERPGIKAGELAEALGVHATTVSPIIRSLRQAGSIRVEKGARSAKHLYPAEHELAHTDGDGCKTEHERKLVEAIKKAPVPLTANEVAANAGINSNATGAILSGLARRGVLHQLSRDDHQVPARWEEVAAAR